MFRVRCDQARQLSHGYLSLITENHFDIDIKDKLIRKVPLNGQHVFQP
jgi:hypothetical protein